MVTKKEICVPWSDEHEWETVRDQIISSNLKNMIRAHETILMWKLRNHALPAYVESTLSILQVLIKKPKIVNFNCVSLSEELDLRLACSIALIRFVNHISSVVASKGESLYSSAKTQNIPDWIINIRHDASHSQNLPTLDVLLVALDISLKWLITNYWNKNFTSKKSIEIEDTSVSSKEMTLTLEKAFNVWNCLDSNKTILGEMKPNFIFSLKEFLEFKNKYIGKIKLDHEISIQNFANAPDALNSSTDNGDQISAKSMKVGELKCILLKFFQIVVKIKNLKQPFLSALLNSSFIHENSFKISKWQKLFEIIHCGKILENLIVELFALAGKGNKKAAKWLIILFPSLILLKKKWTMFKIMKKENKSHSKFNLGKIKKHVQTLQKPKSSKSLILFNIWKPPAFTLDMMTCALLNPETPYLKGLLKYLKLIKPPLPQSTVELIKNLVKIHNVSGENNILEKCENFNKEKIFTIDDLQSMIVDNNDGALAEVDSNGTEWRKSQIDVHVWSKCPLGLLPFQSEVNCRLPENLDWTVEIVQPDKTILKKPLKEWLNEANEIQTN